MNRHGQTICLSMIVRDEAPVIERCIESVRSVIDSWMVVDTGSTDGTQDIVRELLGDLPGALMERPWVDFAHNRTESLAYARGAADYTFVIDADEVLELDADFEMPYLDADSYAMQVDYAGCTYVRRALVRSSLPWRYVGVVHEYLECSESKTESFLAGARIVPHHDGARSRDPNTYRRDALAIERALLEQPEDRRYVFYLAQSYRDAGDFDLALRNYRRRAEMGGWMEEVWYSLYQAAQLRERMGHPWPEVMEDYLRAHEVHPHRAGPLFRVGVHYQRQQQYRLAHLFLAAAHRIPYPSSDRLFVERTLYDYAIAIEYGVSCYYVGDHGEAIATANRLLSGPALPPELFEQVVANRRFSLDELALASRPSFLPVLPHLTVVVPFLDPGPELDECVESIASQDAAPMSVVFVDLGSQDDHASRLPLRDPGVVLRTDLRGGFDEAVRAIAVEAPPNEVVLPLPAHVRLIPPRAARVLADAFSDETCLLLYGRHRDATMRLAYAEPAETAAAHAANGPGLAGVSPLAFRARLAADNASGDLRTTVWRAAGFAGTRFSDDVLTGTPPFAKAISASKASRTPPASPLVSCLLVTRDRLSLTKRAIYSFASQTHPNCELVIVTDGEDRFRNALERHVERLGLDHVRLVFPEERDLSLGALRNLSMAEARGEVLCQWDDDDYSHPERVERQLASLRSEDSLACLMTDHLQLHEMDRLVFWIDWSDGGRLTGLQRLAPGSVMMARDPSLLYPTSGEYARRGEDSVLLATLADRGPITALENEGHLWLYTYHGDNTFPRSHHERISTFGLPRARLLERAATIRDALAHYPIPRPATVVGRDGPAFAIG